METALITGASGGIGFELARIMAAKGHPLVLVARNGDKLQQLKSELETRTRVLVEVFPCDLSKPDAAVAVYDHTKLKGIEIGILVNNAGVGTFGKFHEIPWKETEQLLNLNIAALTQLTRLYLPHMVERKRGRVLNVASTAAFQPGPTMATYFASKAYVLHFSEAIGNELEGTGVTVTALCPGATESGFKDAAKMGSSKIFKRKKIPGSYDVAQYGYKAMMNGDRVAIHGVINYILANSVRLSPRWLTVKLARWFTEGERH